MIRPDAVKYYIDGSRQNSWVLSILIPLDCVSLPRVGYAIRKHEPVLHIEQVLHQRKRRILEKVALGSRRVKDPSEGERLGAIICIGCPQFGHRRL